MAMRKVTRTHFEEDDDDMVSSVIRTILSFDQFEFVN